MNFTKIACLLSCLLIATSCSAGKVFPGESIVTVGKYPALTYYQPGQANKPLVVFLPGMFHLARIAYGVPGTDQRNFLAYQLKQKGYSFLGISYPLQHQVYSKTYPQFTIQDWAEQTCGVIAQQKLNRPVIILAWSMAGALARDLSVECSRRHIDIKAFISLSGVAGNPYIMNKNLIDILEPNDHGLVILKDLYLQWFLKNLAEENTANHQEIIPKDLYRREFLGPIPVNINASMKRYRDGKFIEDPIASIRDAGTFEFEQYPWIGLIVDDGGSDLKINSVDPYNWYQIMANRLYLKYIAKQQDQLTPKQVASFQSMTKKLPQNLTRRIHGSHFFFVGESGAKSTVVKMEELVEQIEVMKKQVETRNPTVKP